MGLNKTGDMLKALIEARGSEETTIKFADSLKEASTKFEDINGLIVMAIESDFHSIALDLIDYALSDNQISDEMQDIYIIASAKLRENDLSQRYIDAIRRNSLLDARAEKRRKEEEERQKEIAERKEALKNYKATKERCEEQERLIYNLKSEKNEDKNRIQKLSQVESTYNNLRTKTEEAKKKIAAQIKKLNDAKDKEETILKETIEEVIKDLDALNKTL